MNQISDRYERTFRKSGEHFEECSKIIPGGVNSSGRYCSPFPLYFMRAKGSKMWDMDGNEFIDYLLGYGAFLLGHSHPKVVEAVRTEIENGFFYGSSNSLEKKLAEMILRNVPCGEMLRFVNTGSEAVSMALRTARAFTKRDVVGRVEGVYHGISDFGFIGLYPLLDKAGPDSAPIPIRALGVPSVIEKTALMLPFNNLEATEALIKQRAEELAAVIISTNGTFLGRVPVEKNYLQGLREITERYGILLIFDEVVTGFRYGLGGAQEYFGVTPDIATLGKIIGGGMPIGAYVGKREIMDIITPTDDVVKNVEEVMPQLGTFSGHPLVMAAGIATLKELEANPPYRYLSKLGERLRSGLRNILSKLGHDCQVHGDADTFMAHFTKNPIRNARDVFRYSDYKKAHDLSFGAMIRGVYVHPGAVGGVLSTAHTEDDIEKTLEIYREVASTLPKS